MKKIIKDIEVMIAGSLIFIAILFFLGGENKLMQSGLTDVYGPAFYPNILAGLLFVCSIFVIWNRYSIYYKVGAKATIEAKTRVSSSKKMHFLFLLTLACPFLLYLGGFLIASVIITFAFCRLISLSNKASGLLSIGLTVCVYLLFNMLLKVQLPLGLFF